MARAERVEKGDGGGSEGILMSYRKQQQKLQGDLGRYIGIWCRTGLNLVVSLESS